MIENDLMESEDCDKVTTDANESDPKFENEDSPFVNVPVEIFLHICSFLTVKDIVLSLSIVCKRFNQILCDENIWKSWIARRWSSRYPIVSIENDNFDWRGACFDIEKHWMLWKDREQTVDYYISNDVHISSIDAVVFVNSGATCISGSRDRSMAVWNPYEACQLRPKYVQQVAHDGWIWRLAQNGDKVYSCSWDNTIKGWTLNNELKMAVTLKCASPVLAMAVKNEDLLLAGDYAKTVYGFDPRNKPVPVLTYQPHNRAVLTIGALGPDIISGSEDKTLAVWDMRAQSIKQKLELGKTCFPSCLSIDNGSLLVGDNKGSIHMFDTRGSTVQLVTSFNMGHKKPISVVKHQRGFIITASLDGSVKMCLPTNPPSVVATIKTSGEVGGMDYFDGTLAVGATSAVEFWCPKNLVGVMK